VGGVKTDLGTTKRPLEETKAQLQRTIGDLGRSERADRQHARRSKP